MIVGRGEGWQKLVRIFIVELFVPPQNDFLIITHFQKFIIWKHIASCDMTTHDTNLLQHWQQLSTRQWDQQASSSTNVSQSTATNEPTNEKWISI